MDDRPTNGVMGKPATENLGSALLRRDKPSKPPSFDLVEHYRPREGALEAAVGVVLEGSRDRGRADRSEGDRRAGDLRSPTFGGCLE